MWRGPVRAVHRWLRNPGSDPRVALKKSPGCLIVTNRFCLVYHGQLPYSLDKPIALLIRQIRKIQTP